MYLFIYLGFLYLSTLIFSAVMILFMQTKQTFGQQNVLFGAKKNTLFEELEPELNDE